MAETVLVTGGAGFIGSHLVEHLMERHYKVTVVDDLSTGSFENIGHLVGRPGFQYIEDDIRRPGLMDELCSKCDMVFHLAATVGVKHILQRPIHTIENNFVGAQAVLSAASRHGTRVLLTSTASVYGLNERLPYTEEDNYCLGPTTQSRWGYAMSKALNELLALAYHKERGLPVAVIRPFNTIGPRQTGAYGHVLPTFIKQAMADELLTIYGDGLQLRCFCDVRDVVRAYGDLAECPAAVGQIFNVGSDTETSIQQLAQVVLSVVDDVLARDGRVPFDERITFVPYSAAYPDGFVEMFRRRPDTTKIESTIGWQAKIPLETSIRNIVENLSEAISAKVEPRDNAR